MARHRVFFDLLSKVGFITLDITGHLDVSVGILHSSQTFNVERPGYISVGNQCYVTDASIASKKVKKDITSHTPW